jgi:hypothetical protein
MACTLTTLTVNANEEGTLVVTCEFEDETGSSVTPSSITWSLLNSDGDIINSRQDVAVATPAASVDIVLHGDDLAMSAVEQNNGSAARYLTLKATYNSSSGTGLSLRDGCTFDICNLIGIT